MNIHEYQAKELLDKYGVANSSGGVASTPEEAEKIATSLAGKNLVVKAQVHAGGRGKGSFKNGAADISLPSYIAPATAAAIIEKLFSIDGVNEVRAIFPNE